jgi:hypothetical protein
MMQPHDLGSGQVPRLVSFLNPSDVPTAATTPSYSKRTIEAQHRIAGGAAKPALSVNLLTRGGCRLSKR